MSSNGNTWRFLLDENLPKSLWRAMQEAGYFVTRVKEEGLRGRPDSAVFRQVRFRATIITRDKDYLRTDLFPTPHSGIIVISLPNSTPVADLVFKVLDTLKQLTGQELANKVYIIEADRVRLQ